MSKISIVRSTIGKGTIFSRFVRCRGRRSLKTKRASAPSSLARSAISRALPLPTSSDQGLEFGQFGGQRARSIVNVDRDEQRALGRVRHGAHHADTLSCATAA
jgi:hypothetical protein